MTVFVLKINTPRSLQCKADVKRQKFTPSWACFPHLEGSVFYSSSQGEVAPHQGSYPHPSSASSHHHLVACDSQLEQNIVFRHTCIMPQINVLPHSKNHWHLSNVRIAHILFNKYLIRFYLAVRLYSDNTWMISKQGTNKQVYIFWGVCTLITCKRCEDMASMCDWCYHYISMSFVCNQSTHSDKLNPLCFIHYFSIIFL